VTSQLQLDVEEFVTAAVELGYELAELLPEPRDLTLEPAGLVAWRSRIRRGSAPDRGPV
jgi:hypothetical protein